MPRRVFIQGMYSPLIKDARALVYARVNPHWVPTPPLCGSPQMARASLSLSATEVKKYHPSLTPPPLTLCYRTAFFFSRIRYCRGACELKFWKILVIEFVVEMVLFRLGGRIFFFFLVKFRSGTSYKSKKQLPFKTGMFSSS